MNCWKLLRVLLPLRAVMQSHGLKSVRIGQSAAKLPISRKNVQRPALRQGVGSSDPKWEAPYCFYKGEDMVCSAWKHAALHVMVRVVLNEHY